MKQVLIVSCTQRVSEQHKTDIFTSYYKNLYDITNHLFIPNENEGLSSKYNDILLQSKYHDYEFIVFCHDDVYIDDALLVQKLKIAHNKLGYDIIGLAGGIDPKIQHPALWHIMCQKETHRGFVGHHYNDQSYCYTSFGPSSLVSSSAGSQGKSCPAPRISDLSGRPCSASAAQSSAG